MITLHLLFLDLSYIGCWNCFYLLSESYLFSSTSFENLLGCCCSSSGISCWSLCCWRRQRSSGLRWNQLCWLMDIVCLMRYCWVMISDFSNQFSRMHPAGPVPQLIVFPRSSFDSRHSESAHTACDSCSRHSPGLVLVWDWNSHLGQTDTRWWCSCLTNRCWLCLLRIHCCSDLCPSQLLKPALQRLVGHFASRVVLFHLERSLSDLEDKRYQAAAWVLQTQTLQSMAVSWLQWHLIVRQHLSCLISSWNQQFRWSEQSAAPDWIDSSCPWIVAALKPSESCSIVLRWRLLLVRRLHY